jgi:uncharacterized protein YbcI
MNPIAQKVRKLFVSKRDQTDKRITGTKLISKRGSSQRKSYRCTVPPARRSCELKVGANLFSALLVNESKCGFGVLIDRLDGLKIGEKFELHTDMGWFTVRTVYINEVAAPKDVDNKCDSWFRLGLKRAGGLFFSGHSTAVGRWPEKGDPGRYGEELLVGTRRKIEAAICAAISCFERDYMGQAPRDIRAYLLGDLLVVRLRSVLAEAKQQLAELLPAEEDRDLLKQTRSSLMETIRPIMEATVVKVTGVKVVTMHHDINTTTGEEVFIFTLARSPDFLK